MKQGQFISIEGIEGAGKTTALALMGELLLQAKYPFIVTREPGGTPLAESMRTLLLQHEGEEKVTAQTELLLLFAGRHQHLQHRILPALARGEWVLCDRFIDATYAYQGGGRALSHDEIFHLDRWIVGSHYPNLTLLLDVTPELGLKRAAGRKQGRDRFEQEEYEFFNRVRDTYLQRAEAQPERIKIIDATGTQAQVFVQIKSIMTTFLQEMED
ncbi:MAG: dTMP kinase [Gammaproteobacteria bacterium]|nr:dTMP kinase [Gammaproteobacteria bacterium]